MIFAVQHDFSAVSKLNIVKDVAGHIYNMEFAYSTCGLSYLLHDVNARRDVMITCLPIHLHQE